MPRKRRTAEQIVAILREAERTDLLLASASPRFLALCELKWCAAEGDGAAFQAVDYWMALQHDRKAQDKITQCHPALAGLDFWKEVRLFVVIGGYVSKLCMARMDYCRAEIAELVTIFQAIPLRSGKPVAEPDSADDWKINQRWPATASRTSGE